MVMADTIAELREQVHTLQEENAALRAKAAEWNWNNPRWWARNIERFIFAVLVANTIFFGLVIPLALQMFFVNGRIENIAVAAVAIFAVVRRVRAKGAELLAFKILVLCLLVYGLVILDGFAGGFFIFVCLRKPSGEHPVWDQAWEHPYARCFKQCASHYYDLEGLKLEPFGLSGGDLLYKAE